MQDYHHQLSNLSSHLAGAEILRGDLHGDDEVAALVKASARFDLLVFGAASEEPVRDMFFGSIQDRVMGRAYCAVLRLSTPREETHQALDTSALASADEFALRRFIASGTLEAGLDVARKEDLFATMAALFAAVVDSPGDGDRVDALEEAFWAREKLQNTAVGDGVALPHATVDSLDKTYLGIFTLARPVAYGTADGREVDVCLSTVGPSTDRNTHLHLLAALAKLVSKGDVLDGLRRAEGPEDLGAALQAAERRLAALETNISA